MEDLTFGEQVKIILGRKGMTIKQLAELIEVRTGKKMSRQNLTQRLGRDNFQEQDMRMIARILDCPFHLSIMSEATAQARSAEAPEKAEAVRAGAAEEKQKQLENTSLSETEETAPDERDMTIGELYEMHQELSELEENAKAGEPVEEIKKELERPKKERFGGIFLRRKQHEEEERREEPDRLEQEQPSQQPEYEEEYPSDEETAVNQDAAPQKEERTDFEPVIAHEDEDEDKEVGEVNPYTGREYQSNSVRMHPTRIGYVQVYDRTIHKWTDMTEWAFLGLQERKKALLGKAYEPPIYLD